LLQFRKKIEVHNSSLGTQHKVAHLARQIIRRDNLIRNGFRNPIWKKILLFVDTTCRLALMVERTACCLLKIGKMKRANVIGLLPKETDERVKTAAQKTAAR